MKQFIENLVRVMDWIFGTSENDLVRLFLSNIVLFKSYSKKEGFQTLLFDIEKDPQEKNNVADEYPDIVKDILSDVAVYEKDIPECAPYWMITKNWVDTFVTGKV